MSTANGPAASSEDQGPVRGALRLRMARDPGHNTFDGGWWPRSRALAVELVDLVEQFPAELGTITRVQVSATDWDDRPDTVTVADRSVDVGAVAGADTRVVDLVTPERTLRVLVVPSELTDDQGDEALLAAATRGNRHSATDLLDTVTEHPDVDPRDHWPAVD
jgi:hypothetical protein